VKPPLLIVNPACGSRRVARSIPAALERVEEVLGDVVILFTARRGHARELARQGAEEGYTLVVAVGGDGTLSEVANGVLEAPAAADVAVGIINLGTGGDFRRSLGIGGGVDQCLAALASGRERLIDVGRARFRDRNGAVAKQYFVNVLSAGLGGLVDRYIESMPTFLGGRAGYYMASLRAVAVSREQPVRVRMTWLDETREETIPAYLVAVCNGRWFGGGMDVAPMALPDDDRLEVITVTARSKPYLANRVRGVYTGRHLNEPTVHHFPCHKIELWLDDERTSRRFLLDGDGEALGSLPLEIEILPRLLRIRA
jgi:YegS/Rv2252/BmrU family lipid kinase